MPPGPAAAITTSGLTKRFGALTVVDGVDLHVPAGAVYGFLGPNGSGKTTTIRMLLGLVFPTSGTFRLLDGTDPLRRVGALVEGPAFHPHLTGTANLYRLDAADRAADESTAPARIAAALDRVGLAGAAGKRYRTYSLGMRQRLGIAAALLQPRELLVLDEPSNGLDPQGTREVRTLIGELAAGGVTVFVSSHLLGEIEQVCTSVGVMSAGRLVWQGPLAALRDRQAPRVVVLTADPPSAARVLTGLGLASVTVAAAVPAPVSAPSPVPDAVDGAGVAAAGTVSALLGDLEAERVVAALVGAGVGVAGFSVQRPSLEDQFVELTGRGFDVSG